MTTLVIVGGGPRATGLLERLAAHADPGRPATVHVVDPHPAGAGRIWRREQSPLLLMNSRAGEVTMFPDASSTLPEPLRPGPTLHGWAVAHGAGCGSEDLRAEAARVTASTFASRRLAGAYLRWCFARAAATPGLEVVTHRARAVGLTGAGRPRVTLSDGRRLDADAVVLAQGAPSVVRAGAGHLPPAHTADVDLSGLGPHEPVLVTGMGLAFVDLVALLTEGRGGRFAADGRYEPSGAEPRLWVGSRRGVPYLPKPAPVPLPRRRRFVTVPRLLELLGDPRPGAFGAVQADVHREILGGWYAGLGAPDGVLDRLARIDPRGAEGRGIAGDLPCLDLDAVLAPLHGAGFATEPELARWMRAHLRRTVATATGPRAAGAAGVYRAVVDVGETLAHVATTASPPVAERARRLLGRFRPMAGFLASGPPPHRPAQLAALSEAGIVRFLGAGTVVEPAGSGWVARSASVPGAVVARRWVEARLPDPDARAGDALLAGLPGTGPRIRVDADYRVLDEHDRPRPELLALGAFATGGALGSFSRPHRDAPFFHQNDAVARRLLATMAVV